ncbi:unnamed protein product [Blepharisma stoltei]|uniref:Uncharacterized protein n=1 Tax=Blepharisma stoltei TaxID=1481888 RepID=A0AAU9JU68_9CILI|nr:unnamed protein product [Blepharisma stoltei]
MLVLIDWRGVVDNFSIEIIGLLINFSSFLTINGSFLMFFHWLKDNSKIFLRMWSRFLRCGFADLTLDFLGLALIEVLWISSSSIISASSVRYIGTTHLVSRQ